MQRLLWSLAFGPYARRSTPPGRVRLARILHRPVARLIRRADVARTNLRLCFPELNEGDVIDLERRAFQSLLRVYLEIPGLAAGSPVEIVKRLDIENLSLLRDGEIDERGAILLSGHLGNWELLAMAAAVASERSFLVVARQQQDFGHLESTRTRFGNRIASFREAPRALHREISSGGVAALLADQSAGEGGVPVTFFGQQTHFFSGPARIALRYRPVVITGFARYLAQSAAYRVNLETLDYDDLDDSPEGVAAFLQRYAYSLESAIRRSPVDWVWHHRRFKATPGVDYRSS